MFKWLWGEKKINTPIKFTSKQINPETSQRLARIHLDLVLDVPNNANLVNTVTNMKINFDMPVGSNMKNVNLTHIEILN